MFGIKKQNFKYHDIIKNLSNYFLSINLYVLFRLVACAVQNLLNKIVQRHVDFLNVHAIIFRRVKIKMIFSIIKEVLIRIVPALEFVLKEIDSSILAVVSLFKILGSQARLKPDIILI